MVDGALIAELAVEAGLPAGVCNLVHGDDRVGRALVAAAIDGVAFTGSAEAGHAIARDAARAARRCARSSPRWAARTRRS